MAGWPPAKNATFTWYFVIRDADGDLVSDATALDVEFSVDGGVFADVAGTEVDEGQGFYSCPISAAEMNGDAIMLMCKTTSAGAKTAAQIIYTSTRQIDNLAFPNVSGRGIDVDATGGVEITANQNVNVAQWLGVAVNALIAGRVDASVGAMAVGVMTANALDDSAVDEIGGGPRGLADITSTTTTVTDSARTEADVDHWKGALILFISGSVNGQCRLITAFDPAADRITFAPATTSSPASQSYRILPAGRADVHFWLGNLVNALITGRIDTSIGAMAADVLTAAALAADAVDEIWDEAMVEPAQGIPSATPAFRTLLAYLYTALRNAITVSSTELTFSDDAGTVTFKKALSDAAGVYTEAEAVSGP